ncbi:MAG TPA: hypothetical protein VI731_11025 [Bacteroidia bacterium]|nr:hypothetical protein [Bacteroidia bacterium]
MQNRDLPVLTTWLVGFLLLVYIILRAATVSFTHDEALTILMYVLQPSEGFGSFATVNNHLLNTWGAKFCLWLFGSSEFSLRLTNIAGGALYLFFGIRLLRKIFGQSWLLFFAFILVSCNAFLLDFFNLCRGYGISMGLLMAHLYCLFSYLSDRSRPGAAVAAMIALAIATLANYTLLPLLILMACIVLFSEVAIIYNTRSLRGGAFLRRMLPPLALFTALAWFALRMIQLMFDLKKAGRGNFEVGGEDGFWITTIGTLCERSVLAVWNLTGANELPVLMLIFVFITFLFGAFQFLMTFFKPPSDSLKDFTAVLFVILVGCAAGIWLQHAWLGIPFSSDRAVMYFITLFSIFISLVLLQPLKFRVFSRILLTLLFILPFFSFIISLNLTRSEMWPTNARAEEAVELILHETAEQRKKGGRVFTAVSFMQYPVYNFYLIQKKAEGVNFVYYEEAGFHPGADYYFGNSLKAGGFTQIWATDSAVLLKNSGAYKDRVLLNFSSKKAAGLSYETTDSVNLFAGLARETLRDTLRAGVLIFLDYTISTQIHPIGGLGVFAVRNENDVKFYRSYPVSWTLRQTGEWKMHQQTMQLNVDALPGDIIEGYVWAGKNTPVSVSGLSVRVIERSRR